MVGLVFCLMGLATGCGEDGPPPGLIADVTRLSEVVAEDPADQALEAVDAIADDRPVHAARLMRTSAIPAAQRQLDTVHELEMTTPRGRTYARRAERAYRARLDALHTHEDVLDQGVSADPLDTLDAIRGRRQAEEQLLRLMRDLEGVVPGAARPRPEPDEGSDQNPEEEERGGAALTGSSAGPTPAP